MTKLSVNVNKIATLRNARGKNQPDLIKCVRRIVQSGAHGITVHPRPDERHIRPEDVYDLKKFLSGFPAVEYNIEGFPSDSFLDMMRSVQPHQCTLVPDPPDVLTSDAGWRISAERKTLTNAVRRLQEYGTRASLFVDPFTAREEDLKVLGEIAPNRIEMYTERYAEAWERKNRLTAKARPASPPDKGGQGGSLFENTAGQGGSPFENTAGQGGSKAPATAIPATAAGEAPVATDAEAELHSVTESYRRLAAAAQALSIDVNAGHGLNQDNLGFFLRRVSCVKEVSIGHALVTEALRDGLSKTVVAYLHIIKSAQNPFA